MTDIDWTKLPPAPWDCHGDAASGAYLLTGNKLHLMSDFDTEEDLAAMQFAALARAAFDVMTRRQWWPMPCYTSRLGSYWRVLTGSDAYREIEVSEHPDPFTALVAADEWMKANVEAKGEPC